MSNSLRRASFTGYVLSLAHALIAVPILSAAPQVDSSSTLREAEIALEGRQYDRALGLVEPLTQDDSALPEFRRLKIKALTRLESLLMRFGSTVGLRPD